VLRNPHYLHRTEEAGRERWLVSYTDVLTILLILFVAVAAKSAAHPKTARIESPPLARARATLEKEGLQPRLEARGLVISLPQKILFSSGEDAISPAAMPVICEIADVLGRMPNHVVLAGYTDAIPIHNQRFHSNWELSAARAMALLEVLSTKYGIDRERLAVASYGSYDPQTSNDTEAGRAENRRVEIVIEDAWPPAAALVP